MVDLTVVLIVDRRRDRGARALHAILAQSAMERLAVLVYDFGHAVCPPLPGTDHPAVTIVPMDHPSSLGRVRLDAFRRATSAWVGFVEEHAEVMPGWADALLARIGEGQWAGVSGEVRNLRPGGVVGAAFYRMNFLHFSEPADGGPSALLPGNNSAYHRESVLALGNDLPNLLEMEPLLGWRLREHGHRLTLEPAARILHANEPGILAFVEANFVFSRLFGALRGDAQGWSAGKRAAYVLAVPLLPLIRMARLVRFIATRRPHALAVVVRGMPALLLSQYAAAAGQALGLLIGEGRSRGEFLILDLDAPRDDRPERNPSR